MRRRTISFSVFLAGISLTAVAAESPLQERFDARIESRREQLIELRRDLHRHPELSGEEKRTAGVVAKRLRRLGFAVETGVGGHGVVATLRGGKPGPLVAFRADMDAVPSAAPDPVPFHSRNPGVRHICGHDIHTTIGLTLAEGLAAVRKQLPGSVMLVFQPAEETATGARAMIADGAMAEPRPGAIFAYHTAPMNVGQLITAPGTLMAWRDGVRVTLTGPGDVAAAAEAVRAGIDAIATIPPSRAGAPATGEFLLVQSGPPSPGAGESRIVSATISTATHTASDSARERIAALIDRLDHDNVRAELDYEKKWVAGVTNDPGLTERAIASARTLLGASAVNTTNTVIPVFSEDFGSFQQLVPGVMFFLGVSNPDEGWVGMPHSPDYVADEEAIFVGARTMGAILFDFLASGA